MNPSFAGFAWDFGLAAALDAGGWLPGAGLLLGAALAGAVVGWLLLRTRSRRQKEEADERVKQMSTLIEHADCVLWESQVTLLDDGDWRWSTKVYPSALTRRIFGEFEFKPEIGLWSEFDIPTKTEMDQRARAAIEAGYEQEFAATRNGRTVWMHEQVSIMPLGGRRYWLVGLAVDCTRQHAAEGARARSEQALERILSHAQCTIWQATVVDVNGRLEWPHFDIPRCQLTDQIFGEGWVYSPERGFWDTLAIPEMAEMNERSSRAIRKGDASYAQQFHVITPAGRTIWLHERVSITPVDAKRWRLVGVVTDITAQVEAREALQRSEHRLSQLLERTDSTIWQARVERVADGRLDWRMTVPHSKLYRRVFGVDPDLAGGFLWKERGVPEADDMERRSREAILGGLPGYEQIFHIGGVDGEIWLQESVTIKAIGPDAWDLVGIITDITERHRIEAALRESEQRLATLLEHVDCMIWQGEVRRLGPDQFTWKIFTPRSQLYRRIHGRDPEGECHFNWGDGRVPEFPEMRARSRRALVEGAPHYEQVFHCRHQELGDIWLREKATIRPLGPDHWELAGVVTDITAQHQADLARQASERRLLELLGRADCLLWEATVQVLPGVTDITGWRWEVYTQPSMLYQRLHGKPCPEPGATVWPRERVPDRPRMDERCRDAVLGRRPGYEQVFHYTREDGSVIWISENVTIHEVGEDRFSLVGIAVDITAQRLSEAARQASEQRLSEILTRADCLLWEGTAELTDSDWRWQFDIQPSLLCQKLYGRIQPPTEAGLWRSFDIPERKEMNERCLSAMREGRLGYEQVFRIRRPDGKVIWISENVTIRPLGGSRYSLVGVAVDITPQRGAEEALAAEKERLAVTLRAMSEAVITTDTNGIIQFMNPAAAALLELEAADCLGRPVQEVCRLQSSRSEKPVEVPVGRVARGDAIVNLPPHTLLCGRDPAKPRVVEGCCAPIHAADSRVTGTVLVLRDVTEQERLEQELMRATRLESVGVLAGGIAHDFNNILTAVMGNLALAQLDVDSQSPAGVSLRSAEKAALRARDLTQQLLTFAKGGEPVRAAVQLEAIVREVADFALHGSQVKAHYDLAPDLWPADVDKGQIGRVVQNLVINSVQAMPQGGQLRISVRNDPQDGEGRPGLAAGDYIQIAITDTGEGIRPEHLSRIFDPYFTTKSSGTGLGLAAVYSIVKKHGGQIDVESVFGRGTTFRIWLPALRQGAVRVATQVPWGTLPRLRGRVLFMDDEQIIRDMATTLLRRFGLEVVCAEDGALAVEQYRTALAEGRRFDLVIMDLTVPGGMGGLAALARLRELDPAVKAIVSSGYSSDPVLANHREHGFIAVVAKPYEVGELEKVLRELLPPA
jgi:signal transduction histidine kinase